MKFAALAGLPIVLAIAVWWLVAATTPTRPADPSQRPDPFASSGPEAVDDPPLAAGAEPTSSRSRPTRPDHRATQAAPPRRTDWPLAQQFTASRDLYQLAETIRTQAIEGDAEAMWTLGRIYDSCELLAVKYGSGHQPGEARRSLETVISAMPPNAAVYHRRQFERCQGFVQTPEALENAEIWQTLAAEAGHPAARMKSWLDRRMDADIGAPSRAQVIALVQSGHPDALAAAPRLLALQTPEPPQVNEAISELAWTLAACSLGMDCSPMGESTQIRCIWANCGPEDHLPDVIRAEADPYIYQQAISYAERLEAHLNTGTLGAAEWVELQALPNQGEPN